MKYCTKCGKELSDAAQFCDSCGTSTVEMTNNSPVAESQKVDEAVNTAQHNQSSVYETTTQVPQYNISYNQAGNGVAVAVKKKPSVKLILIIVAAVLVVAIIAGLLIVKTTSINKYETMLKDSYNTMVFGAEQAEYYATLESKVWRNCIHENSSNETDKYTKNDYGYFYSDFNDALSEFYVGESATYAIVESNVETVNKFMLELKDCPKELEEEYDVIKSLYISYSEMTDLVVGGSSYSLNSFTEALDSAKSNYKNSLSSARLIFE